MPVAYVLLVVQVLAPLDQVVHLVVEITILQLHEALVVKWVLVQLLQSKFVKVLCNLWLFLNELGIFSILIEFSEPLELFDTLFFGGELHALFLVKVKHLRFVRCAQLHRIVRGEDLVGDGPPAVVLVAFVPAVVLVVGVLVEANVDRRLLLLLLDLHIVPRRERVNVHHASMRKDLVIYQRRKFLKEIRLYRK